MLKQPIDWRIKSFKQLSLNDLYCLLTLRQSVFVVEQNCPYLDADGLDQQALHVLGWSQIEDKPTLAAYLRITAPGQRFDEPSLGRVATATRVRRQGVGKALMDVALTRITVDYPNTPIRISAQRYLEAFYKGFGFEVASEPYLEDNIPHVEMLRR